LLSGFGMSDAAAPDPFLIALAVLELVADASRQAPVLVSLDDMHWMDEPSVDVAAFVARRIEGERVMLLASVRAGSTLLADNRRWSGFLLLASMSPLHQPWSTHAPQT
jgi:predicted ATPase